MNIKFAVDCEFSAGEDTILSTGDRKMCKVIDYFK